MITIVPRQLIWRGSRTTCRFEICAENRLVPQGAIQTVSSAGVSPNFETKHAEAIGATLLSVALIGPNEERRSVVARALAETRRANVREFDSYPPKREHLHGLLASFEVVILDLDSEPDVALELVERASADNAATIMVYSEKTDPKFAIHSMRAGAREYLLLPLEQGAVADALVRATVTPREKALPAENSGGDGLHVFVGSKGGSGVTTVACNVAIALAQRSDQSVLLIDLALPIGDAALCLGITAAYSTEDALRSIDALDASSLQNLLVKHRSGVFVLAAPTKVPDVEVSKGAIDKLIAIARREFDHVIVDVGSRIDVAAKVLFEDASTIYLVTQTGISELRNSNRLISQFFAEGSPNLEVVINRFESRFLEPANEEVIAKALGRPVRWKIPDDQDAARALQCGDSGLPDTRISRISLEMAGSITGRPIPQEKKRDFDVGGLGKNMPQVDFARYEATSPAILASADARTNPNITWPAPGPITYGNKLTFDQLNATASVEGTLVYTPGPGYVLPVGTHSLWVTFTPADSGRYVSQQASVSIVVAKATPVLSWPTPAKIIYGAALDGAQLNASASVPGRLDYSSAPGEVLPPGMHTLSVTFTPADTANYTTAKATVSLLVAKATSEIQWPRPDPISYGTKLSTLQLCAMASVPGSFEYNPGLGAVLAAGEHQLSVVFTPADTVGYSPSRAAASVTVAKANPRILWPTPDPIAHGAALSPTQLNAKASVPGSFAFAPATGEILAPGVHELSVSFTPTDTLNYITVSATVPLTVAEKSATHIAWPVPSAISYGVALSAAQLNATASVPGTFVYTPSEGHVLAPGRYTLSASFTPSDTEKYETAQATVVLEVEGSPDNASLPAEAAETLSNRTLDATNFAPADSVPAEITAERTVASTIPRETRTYKGAVYEKREDGQWHLQKN
jgi:MinD-like ATPase involved in chromosome partitioning or flagellar assembly/ActR/RegA family two-component response regulator